MSLRRRVARTAIPLVLVAAILATAMVRGTRDGGSEAASPQESDDEAVIELVPQAPLEPPVDVVAPPGPAPASATPTGLATMPGVELAPVTRSAPLSGDLGHVHDPTIVRAGDAWYVMSTGAGLPIRRSTDLSNWDYVGEVFPMGLPSWVFEHVSGLDPFARDAWAPDITYANGRWYLYWSVGEFGTQDAVIGLMTNTTLNPADPNYHWVDEGLVLASDGNDATMAIDPAAVTAPDGSRWLAYGSFWDGVFIRRLDGSGKFASGSSAHNIAKRSPSRPNGVEAASLVYRDGWWWLFVSVGTCCKGVSSNYSIVAGRSQSITGPFLDATGRDLRDNGGTSVTGSYGNMAGPGHGTVIDSGGQWLMAHHYYDRSNGGVPTLAIRPVHWTLDGWPIVASHGFAPTAPAGADAVWGTWQVSGFPEERSDRRFSSLSIELRADGTVSPSGTWALKGDRVVVSGLNTDSGPREVWWVLDFGATSGFGRDDRTSAIRATR